MMPQFPYLPPSDDDSDDNGAGPLNGGGTQPPAGTPDARSAADLIREKVARIYGDEPAAAQEAAESAAAQPRSQHQQFMYELNSSGKDLATIQTEWHNYYQALPAEEKHKVWQEFYDSQSSIIHPDSVAPVVAPSTPQAVATPVAGPSPVATPGPIPIPEPAPTPEPSPVLAAKAAQQFAEHKHEVIKPEAKRAARSPQPVGPKLRDARSRAEIQAAVRHKVSAGGKLEAKHHLQSLLFGLGMGAVVVIIFLFGFFNEVFIAPFIQPSRVATATPIIVTSNSVAPTSTPEVIIPKINVEIPVNFSETSTDENTIENDLESGVVHYPTTVMPGQVGNTAFFGHSSNNIFNKGKYKFAFVLLHTLVVGDTFYLTYNGQVYVYKVISRSVVDPSDISVLGSVAGQTATATLITCDPPGTSLHRLIVVGQQISPDPSGNSQPVITASASSSSPTSLPGNGPTLWARFSGTIIGKVFIVLAVIGGLILARRWLPWPVAKPAI